MARLVNMTRRRALVLLSVALVAYILQKALLKQGLKVGVEAGGPWWESFALICIAALLVGLVAAIPFTMAINRRRLGHIGLRRTGFRRFEGTVGGVPVRLSWPDKHWLFGSLDKTRWVWSTPVRGVDASTHAWAVAESPGKTPAQRWNIPRDPAWQEFFQRNEEWLATAPLEAAGVVLRDGRLHVETERALLRQDLARIANWTVDLARRLERLPERPRSR